MTTVSPNDENRWAASSTVDRGSPSTAESSLRNPCALGSTVRQSILTTRAPRAEALAAKAANRLDFPIPVTPWTCATSGPSLSRRSRRASTSRSRPEKSASARPERISPNVCIRDLEGNSREFQPQADALIIDVKLQPSTVTRRPENQYPAPNKRLESLGGLRSSVFSRRGQTAIRIELQSARSESSKPDPIRIAAHDRQIKRLRIERIASGEQVWCAL